MTVEEAYEKGGTKAVPPGAGLDSHASLFSPSPEIISEVSAAWRTELGEKMDGRFGPSMVYPGVIKNPVPLDVRVYAPEVDRPWYRLLTCGASVRAFPLLSDPADLRHLEFILYLPATWSFDFNRYGEAAYWPIRLLGMLGRLVHMKEAAFRVGDTVAFSDPPVPFVQGSLLSSVVILPPMLEDEDFKGFRVGSVPVRVYGVQPITGGEVSLKWEKGIEPLLQTLDEGGVHPVVDPSRMCTATNAWPQADP